MPLDMQRFPRIVLTATLRPELRRDKENCPGPVQIPIVMERRHALKWILDPSNVGWDVGTRSG